jgi:thiol:disulfide interchange protein
LPAFRFQKNPLGLNNENIDLMMPVSLLPVLVMSSKRRVGLFQYLFILLFCFQMAGCGLLAPVSREDYGRQTDGDDLPEIRGEIVKEKEREEEREELAVYGVLFESDDFLQPALEKATSEEKLVFIDFYTNWCLPCKVMDENVFPDSSLGAFMNEKFINLKINAEYGNGSNLAFLYQVKQFPTLLFLDEKGKELLRREGGLGTSAFFELAQNAFEKKEKDADNEGG